MCKVESQKAVLPWSKYAIRKVSSLAGPTGRTGTLMVVDPAFTLSGGTVLRGLKRKKVTCFYI